MGEERAPRATLAFFKLVVRDLPAMIDFYRSAFGFEVDRKIEGPDFEEAIMSQPGSKSRFAIVLYHWTDGREVTVGNGHGPVGLMTRDVSGFFDKAIGHGASEVRAPFDFGGAKIAFLNDPEGHEIELIQNAA